MTREQKLALIVGFSLVLLVGVLISDHLSRARQAKIASVGPGETQVQVAATPPSGDPMSALNRALATPAPATTPGEQVAATAPAPAITEPAPSSSPPPPVTIAQGPPRPGEHDTALERAIADAGGRIRPGTDGTPVIILPPEAAKLGATPGSVGMLPVSSLPVASPKPASSPVTKYLATNESFKTHTVQKGETLFQITARYYGTGHVWRELARFNDLGDKDGAVRIGSRLKIPSKEILLGKAAPVETVGHSAPASGNPAARSNPAHRPEVPARKPEIKLATYTVKKGETLGEISKKVLGSARRWQELADFNKLEDEDSIAAGTVLKVPPMRG